MRRKGVGDFVLAPETESYPVTKKVSKVSHLGHLSTEKALRL